MQQGITNIPEITKNIIIINLLMYLATLSLDDWFFDSFRIYYVQNEHFRPYQLVTSFFMHSNTGISHIFFNMFVLFMIGSEVEHRLGPKRFLFLYLAAGFGANLLKMGVDYGYAQYLMSSLNSEEISWAINNSYPSNANPVDAVRSLAYVWHYSALGASGAVYGILFTFAALYPNRILYLLIPPMPIKAKYFAWGLAVIELSLHVSSIDTGIGHFVHLSGALIALLVLWIWRRQGARF